MQAPTLLQVGLFNRRVEFWDRSSIRVRVRVRARASARVEFLDRSSIRSSVIFIIWEQGHV